LLEVLIAILIFSVGVLGLVGLQAIAMQSTTMSKSRVDASFVANQRVAQIWTDSDLTVAGLSAMAESDTDVSNVLPDGLRTTTIDGNTVTVTVSWRMPSETERQTYTTVAVVSGP
jgi:type IV pilus assembly protein PilV